MKVSYLTKCFGSEVAIVSLESNRRNRIAITTHHKEGATELPSERLWAWCSSRRT